MKDIMSEFEFYALYTGKLRENYAIWLKHFVYLGGVKFGGH